MLISKTTVQPLGIIHRVLSFCLLCGLLCILAGCGSSGAGSTGSTGNAGGASAGSTTGSNSTGAGGSTEAGESAETALAGGPKSLDELTANTIRATITMEDGAAIVLELYPDLAPQSVRNFVYLARQGFYDGLTFHRIMSGFMIQGGCPLGTGTGGPGYRITGEFSANGFTNELKHERGVLSMARANDYDTAGSQFFIMHAANPGLDGAYAAFGRVVEGMDVVDDIAKTPNSGPNGAVADADKPVMASITIDDDIELPPPDMIR